MNIKKDQTFGNIVKFRQNSHALNQKLHLKKKRQEMASTLLYTHIRI